MQRIPISNFKDYIKILKNTITYFEQDRPKFIERFGEESEEGLFLQYKFDELYNIKTWEYFAKKNENLKN